MNHVLLEEHRHVHGVPVDATCHLIHALTAGGAVRVGHGLALALGCHGLFLYVGTPVVIPRAS